MRTQAAPRQTVGVPFAKNLRDHGAAPALLTHHRTLTYRELADRVDHYRERLGATRQLVLLELSAHTDLVALYLAALADGHAVIVCPPDNPQLSTTLTERYQPTMTARTEFGFPQLVTRDAAAPDLHPELALLIDRKSVV